MGRICTDTSTLQGQHASLHHHPRGILLFKSGVGQTCTDTFALIWRHASLHHRSKVLLPFYLQLFSSGLCFEPAIASFNS